MQNSEVERLFSGLIGTEYDQLKIVSPAVVDVSRRIGEALAAWRAGEKLAVLEIGCGTGLTTLSLLHGREDAHITAVDNEPAMLSQATQNLSQWIEAGRLQLIEADALTALQSLPTASLDAVASGYALHNFLHTYREKVHGEICRVLKPGGLFINGDRYALDDIPAHTRLIQEEIRFWFQGFGAMQRYDLLEHWIVHLFSDESEDHVMRLQKAVCSLQSKGFDPIDIRYREGVNTLLVAHKPGGQ